MKINPKKKLKSLSYLKDKAWKAFSVFIRKRGADSDGFTRCYTCGVSAHWKQLQAGHAIPGRNNAVLLDPDICRPQCVYCNVYKHGMHHVFTTKLILENGEEWWLKKLADSNRIVKVSRFEYEILIKDYENLGASCE